MSDSSDSDEISMSLTSIFTPPSSCRTHWTYEANFYNSVSGGLLLQNALDDPLDTDCFPPGFSNSGRESLAPIYSPGFCPIGYSTPAQFLNGPTTTVICCLTSFSYFSTLTTIDNFSPASSYIFAGCISTYPAANGTTTVLARDGDTDLTLTAVSGSITMWGQPIQVAFQAKDLSLFTTSTSAALSSTTAQPSSNLVTQAAATATPLSSTSPLPITNNGLSTGAKAGIGVGVTLVGAILMGLAFFLLRRRRHSARSEEQRTMINMDEVQGPPGSQEKGNLYRDEVKEDAEPSELDNRERPIPELDSSARTELHNQAITEIESRENLPLKAPPE